MQCGEVASPFAPKANLGGYASSREAEPSEDI